MDEKENTQEVYGILVDVSGSMESALTTKDIKLSKKHVNRAHAVFDTIFKTIKEDEIRNVAGKILAFALAFGLSDADHQHCDLFGLFKFLLTSYDTKANCRRILTQYGINNNVQQYIQVHNNDNNKCQIIGYQPLINMAERNGAPYAGKYIRKHLETDDCGHLFMHFHHRKDLLRKMVKKLPEACKSQVADFAASTLNDPVLESKSVGGFLLKVALLPVSYIGNTALRKGKDLILSPIYHINRKSRTQSEITRIIDRLSVLYPLRSTDDEKTIDDDESLDIDELLKDIRKYIFGRTPMCKSLNYAKNIFKLNRDRNDKKRLLIISDGESTDGNPVPISRQIQYDSDVVIICCFITNQDISNPKQLYYVKDNNWTKGAQTLFEMASCVSNTDSSLSLLLKNGWELSSSGQSKLFIQANHPDIIEQFCAIIKHIGKHNDAIMDMVGHYDFDKYINNKMCNEEPPQQHGGTCYANAAAMGLHLSMARIKHRDGGYPAFDVMRQEMINKYGTDGAKTKTVIDEFCKKHRLHYQKVNDRKAIAKVISARRILVSNFRLSEEGWDNFSTFFNKNRKAILSKNDILKRSGYKYFEVLDDHINIYNDKGLQNKSSLKFKSGKVLKGERIKKYVKIPKQYGVSNTVYCHSTDVQQIDGHSKCGGGHAVVLIRIEPKCLIFMNSWGTNWGDKGFFRIENTNVLEYKNWGMGFFDIYWTLNDLSANEKRKYQEYCKQRAVDYCTQINEKIPSLYELNYKCPNCNRFSKINEYLGDFIKAKCPQCRIPFKPNGIELIRSLYSRQLSNQ